MVELNFGDVESGGFPVVDEDYYHIRVVESSVAENRKKDGQNLKLTTAILGSDNHGDEFNGRKLFENASLKPAALWKVQMILNALTEEDWSDDGMQLDPLDLVGLEAKVMVTIEDHWDPEEAAKGTKVNKMTKWYPLSQETSGGGNIL